MLKEVLASNAAKLVAACVCPVVGAGVVALEVPKVRAAVHKATAPKPKRETRIKRRSPAPDKKTKAADAPVQTAMMCPQPLMFESGSLAPQNLAVALPTPRIEAAAAGPERIYVQSGCPGVQAAGAGTMRFRFAAVPEPASWAQMIAGFALLGGALRARHRVERRPA